MRDYGSFLKENFGFLPHIAALCFQRSLPTSRVALMSSCQERNYGVSKSKPAAFISLPATFISSFSSLR